MPRTLGFELLAISDRQALPDGALEPWLWRIGAAGVGAAQIREKDLSDRDLFALGLSARQILPPTTTLLINGRVDLALAIEGEFEPGTAGGVGTLGVHLPGTGLAVAPLRARFGADLLIGRSTHSLDEIARAREEGADYATFGPVFATPSKAAFGPPVGLAAFARAAALGLPLYALGGVTLEHLPELARVGARGVAGIRLFLEPTDLPALVATARALFASRTPTPLKVEP